MRRLFITVMVFCDFTAHHAMLGIFMEKEKDTGAPIVILMALPIRMGITSEDKEAYFREQARLYKEKLWVPIILVGGIRTFELAERLITDGYADYISMSRPFICEPDLVARWRSGNLERSKCFSDNLCLSSAISGKGFYCVTEEKRQKA